jgi:hypothetical protein
MEAAIILNDTGLFTSSKGWPAFPSDVVTTIYDHREKSLHEQLIKLRHTVYAHSDSVSYSIRPYRNGKLAADIISAPELRITADDAALFLTMSSKLLSSISLQMEALRGPASAFDHADSGNQHFFVEELLQALPIGGMFILPLSKKRQRSAPTQRPEDSRKRVGQRRRSSPRS